MQTSAVKGSLSFQALTRGRETQVLVLHSCQGSLGMINWWVFYCRAALFNVKGSRI